MAMKQISVFLDDSVNRFGEIIRVLAGNHINIRAINITNTADLGILRLIVNKQDDALRVLNSEGFTTRVSDVAAVEIDDSPGGLAGVMELFQKTRVKIEYLYTTRGSKDDKAVVIFKLQNHEEGLLILTKNGLTMVEKLL